MISNSSRCQYSRSCRDPYILLVNVFQTCCLFDKQVHRYLKNLVATMHTVQSIEQTARHHITYKYADSIASDESQAYTVVGMMLLPCHKAWRVACGCSVVMCTTDTRITRQ